MVATRVWLLLVTFLAGALLLIVALGPLRGQAELDRESGRRAERAAQSSVYLMHLNMQKWVEAATQVGADAVLQEAIDEADRDSKELSMLQKSLRERLRGVRDKTHAEVAIALDVKGRVIAQLGLPEGKLRESFVELAGVEAALRGTRGEVVWLVHDHAYRVAVAPIGKSDRVLGAIALGQELGPELLATVRDQVDTDLILASPRQVYASVPARPIAAEVPAALAAAVDKPDVKKSGKLAGARVGHGVDAGVLAGVVLDSGAETLVLCAFVSRPEVGGPIESTLASARGIVSAGMSGALPIVVVLAVLGIGVLLLVLGQLMVWLDGTRPQKALFEQIQLVARGDLHRMDADRAPRRFAALVRALNLALDRIGQRARPAPVVHTPPPSVSTASRAAMFTPPPSVPTRGPSPADRRAANPPEPEAHEQFVAAPNSAESMWTAPSSPDPAPPRRAATPAPAPAPAPAAPTVPEDPELRSVFRDFVDTRETCGESTEGLTYEKFAQRLLTTKTNVLKTHGGTEVKYGVYVKDGKAAIKVTPVK